MICRIYLHASHVARGCVYHAKFNYRNYRAELRLDVAHEQDAVSESGL